MSHLHLLPVSLGEVYFRHGPHLLLTRKGDVEPDTIVGLKTMEV